MSTKRPIDLSFAALAALWVLAPWGPRDSGAVEPWPTLDAPLVVELFTSQSCSSCPPADAVLEELARERNVIALGCHVTYWNHLDWRDTLSLPACTERQRAYAKSLGSGVYTPQMVVNGRSEFVGSDRHQALRAIVKNANALAPIALNLGQGKLTTQLPALAPALTADRPLTLWLAILGPEHTQAMRSGENRGRTIKYVNSVKALEFIGPWPGTTETRTIALPRALQAGERIVLLAQQGPAGAIVAAGQAAERRP